MYWKFGALLEIRVFVHLFWCDLNNKNVGNLVEYQPEPGYQEDRMECNGTYQQRFDLGVSENRAIKPFFVGRNIPGNPQNLIVLHHFSHEHCYYFWGILIIPHFQTQPYRSLIIYIYMLYIYIIHLLTQNCQTSYMTCIERTIKHTTCLPLETERLLLRSIQLYIKSIVWPSPILVSHLVA